MRKTKPTEIAPNPQSRTREDLRRFELSAAFRETFLVEMPNREKEIYRRFGQILWCNGVTENDDIQEPLKRCALKAILADLEHLSDFIEVSFSGISGERGEQRLAQAAFYAREQLLAVAGELKNALGIRQKAKKSNDSAN